LPLLPVSPVLPVLPVSIVECSDGHWDGWGQILHRPLKWPAIGHGALRLRPPQYRLGSVLKYFFSPAAVRRENCTGETFLAARSSYLSRRGRATAAGPSGRRRSSARRFLAKPRKTPPRHLGPGRRRSLPPRPDAGRAMKERQRGEPSGLRWAETSLG
jgi:hypothetical protein